MNYTEEIRLQKRRLVTRRYFFKECRIGFGSLALASLFKEDMFAAPLQGAKGEVPSLAPQKPHFPAKAKRVIYLFQAGAPSQLELFDNKPELAEVNGKVHPAGLLKGHR